MTENEFVCVPQPRIGRISCPLFSYLPQLRGPEDDTDEHTVFHCEEAD